MQLFAFGVNHHTAPLAVREQVTFHAANLEEALRDLVNHEPVSEAAIISTCNRTEVYCSTPEPDRAIDWLARFHHLKSQALEPFLYTLPRERAVDACIPCGERAGFHGPGRAADSRTDEGRGEVRRARRYAWHRASQAVPVDFLGGEGSAHPDRNRHQLGVDGRGGGESRGAHLSEHCRAEGAVHRRRRNDRALCHTLRRQTAAPEDFCQSHARARRGTGGPLPGAGDHSERHVGAVGNARHRGVLYGKPAADPRQGHDRTRASRRAATGRC